MRPRRLEIAGFTSFKEATEIDFEGSDFFALVGATGAGKSSVIDAMCFALYGSVPRYDNRNLVAPVISHGRVEARVLLDFSIEGKDYTAVRVVRRSGKGATTKEARLECGEEILAGNADEVTEAVERLIGLSFDHFTRCVVLPQGEFARFLHDKPSERQGLVVKLLNLDVYAEMRRLATERAASKKAELTAIEHRLESELAEATPEALSSAKERVKRLEQLRKRVVAAKPRLDETTAAAATARLRLEEATRWSKLVGSVRVPDDVGDLAEGLSAAERSLKEAVENEGVARKKVESARRARAKLPDREPLVRALGAHDRLVRATKEEGPSRRALETAADAQEAAAKVLEQSELSLRDAEDERAEAQRAHAAHHVAGQLAVGEPCPVCLQPVAKLPKRPKVLALDKGAVAVESAQSALKDARAAERRASAALARAQSDLAAVQERIAEWKTEVASFPVRADLVAQLDRVERAEKELDAARTGEDQARRAVDRARESVDRLKKKEEKARRSFESTRDTLVPLGPPTADRRQLLADWAALEKWAAERLDELLEEATVARAEADQIEKRRAQLVDEMVAACRDCELHIAPDEDPLEAVVEARSDAKNAADRLAAAIEKARELRRHTKTLEIDLEAAEALALHLSARPGRFENWLVNAALHRLVDGATVILDELSNGQYALTVDDQGSFQVIDRHNADETRSAKTLSGGETFLASLSLALALADQLADLASEGAASLEAIFLDEGFGTLDPETLDTVAATVENLASSGRMVGIVTHVRELADRVPVQFRVRKETGSSTVERVLA